MKRAQEIMKRATILQKKTNRPVQFEITEQTRESLTAWINYVALRLGNYLIFSSHDTRNPSPHAAMRIL